MTITIKATNRTREVLIQVKGLAPMTKKSIKSAFFDIGKDLKKTTVDDIMHKPKHGRKYHIKLRSGQRITHIASRAGSSGAGEAPANIDEALADSVDYNVNGSQELIFGAGNDLVKYAGFLELGTRRMEKRQYLIKAINSNARNISTRIQKDLKKST